MTFDSHGAAATATGMENSAASITAIRAIVFTMNGGKKKHAGMPRVFSSKNLGSRYGFFGVVAGAVVAVVVAGLVAGFSVVVVTGFLFNAVMMSVVKSMVSFE